MAAQKQQSLTKEVKPKHRPSITPTGLPGDEPKTHYHKKRREKLGEVVDTLLVPEHKAARRLIRRSQRRNPAMASGSNMTLYERIMAYRLLKQKGVVGAESKNDVSEEDPRKIERSDTGWGSVDISQYTNKKDSDDNRSPTPPPTLSHPVGTRRLKQVEENGALTTARDVHVQIDDKLNKQERGTPVRSNTPTTNKRSTTPGQERTSSRTSSDLNKLLVLPPIQNSHDRKDLERAKDKTEVREKWKESSARIEKQEEKLRNGENDEKLIMRDIRNEVEETNGVIVRQRYEDRNDNSKRIHDEDDRKKKGNMKNEDRNYSRTERIVSQEKDNTFDEKTDERVNVNEEDLLQKRNKSREKEHSTVRRNNHEGLQHSNSEEEALAATAIAPYIRQSSEDEAKSSRQPKLSTEPPSRKTNSRESPPESKRLAPKPQKSRNTPRRRTPMDDEIERLDKMVDRDLNEIIQSLGNKERKPRNDEMEENLKKKIFDSKFQSDMDNYLRDI